MAFRIVSGGQKLTGNLLIDREKPTIPKFKVLSGGEKTATIEPTEEPKFKVVSEPPKAPAIFAGRGVSTQGSLKDVLSAQEKLPLPQPTPRARAIGQALVKGATGIKSAKPELEKEYPGATFTGEALGGIAPYLIPGGTVAKFALIPTAKEIVRQVTTPEEKLTGTQRFGKIATAGAGGAITGKIFKGADLGKTVLSRVGQRALGAGGVSVPESLLQDVISGRKPNIPGALATGGLNAVVIGAVGALTEIPQLRGAIMSEATRLNKGQAPKDYVAAKTIVEKSLMTRPDTLSPTFQKAMYEKSLGEAQKHINDIAGFKVWNRSKVAEVVGERGQRQLLEGYYEWLYNKGKAVVIYEQAKATYGEKIAKDMVERSKQDYQKSIAENAINLVNNKKMVIPGVSGERPITPPLAPKTLVPSIPAQPESIIPGKTGIGPVFTGKVLPEPVAQPTEGKVENVSKVARTVLEPPNSALSGFAHGKENVIKTIPNVSDFKGQPVNATILQNEQGKIRVLLHGEDTSAIDAGALLRKEGDSYVVENIANNETINNAIPLLKSIIKENLGKIKIDANAPRAKLSTPTGEGQKPPGMQIFRMDEPVMVINTTGKQITLPKGEEYRTYDLGNGKVRLQDGKQITVYEGELNKLKGKLLPPGEQPMAGGQVFKHELTKDEVSPDLLSQLYKSEQEYIQKIIVEGKSPTQVAKELGEDITDTTKGLKFAIDHYREIEQGFAQGMEKAGLEEETAKQKDLKDYLRGKLKLGLTLKGEYTSLKHLPWLFSQTGGVTPDTLVGELQGMGFLQEGQDSDQDVIELIKKTFASEITGKAETFAGRVVKQAQAKLKAGLEKKYKAPKAVKIKKPETQVGRGTVLNTKTDTDRSKLIQIMENMPFSLLGNKAEVISRLSAGLKNLLTQGVEKVYDLFGGAKGYRSGIFPDLPSENYSLNEFSDERFNYYKNIQNPANVEKMKLIIKDLRGGLIDRIAKAFEISTERDPNELRKAINKWLQRGLEKDRAAFAREIIQNYGNELLAQAVADKFQSPESSAIYYFLQNTSVFGLSKVGDKYHWSQGIIRTSGDKAEIRDSMRRIEEADKQLDMESKRDAKMPLSQRDAWEVMDDITTKIKSGELDPQKTVVLVDPQYLNPSQEGGTYSVGQKDAYWQGHSDNLNRHLLPLIQTGVKVIYTNNDDINLIRWLKQNKLPYNIEEAIGATANRGGRDEIISFINYQLPKEYTHRTGTGAVGGEQYLGEEITGESETFRKWIGERRRLEREGAVKPPSFGKEWTPEQRKSLYVEALRKGLIYKDYTGKEHDMLHNLIKFYPGASFDQLREYITNLTGEPDSPPKLFKLFGDITKDTEVIKLLKGVSGKWQDINKVEINTLDPVRIVEKVTQQDLWDNILGDNTFSVYAAADEAMYDRLVQQLNELDANRQGISKGSKESAEIMRKFEAGEKLTDKEQKVVDYLRKKYDALIAEANEMRMRLKKRPIPYRQDYMTHIREQNMLSDFFKGDLDAAKNISQGQLEAIRKGDYTKGNMPFNRFAQRRTGPRTKYDAIGNYEIYLRTMLKEIYYTPAITHARKFIEYALIRQPNAYMALDRLANDLKGKTSLNDKWFGGVLLSTKPIKKMRSLIAKSALLGNLNFWLMNSSNFVVSYDELGNYMNKGMTKFLGTKKWRQFAFKNSNMLKGRTIDPDIDPGSFKTLEAALGYVTNLLEYNNVGSTFVGAYFKGIDQGFNQSKAIKYADAIARRTQVGYKKYELNAWMRSNSGMFLSQFQTWTFNAMNHLIYDLKLGNVPGNLVSKFTGKGKKPVRWGAFFTLVVISMLLNYLYKKAGLRQPYGPESATPRIPGIGGAVPPMIRTGQNIVTAFTGKKPETKQKAAIRAVGSFIPAGTQIGRFIQGQVLPQKWEPKGQSESGKKFPSKFKSKFPSKFK